MTRGSLAAAVRGAGQPGSAVLPPPRLVGVGEQLLNVIDPVARPREPLDGLSEQPPAGVCFEHAPGGGMPLRPVEARRQLHDQAADREKPLVGETGAHGQAGHRAGR